MMGRTRQQWSILATRPQRTIALPLTVLSVSLVAAAQKTAPASFRVIYSFTGGKDDAYPYGGLVIDRNGNLYGTASQGKHKDHAHPPTMAAVRCSNGRAQNLAGFFALSTFSTEVAGYARAPESRPSRPHAHLRIFWRIQIQADNIQQLGFKIEIWAEGKVRRRWSYRFEATRF
jgi:hypothetical protein